MSPGARGDDSPWDRRVRRFERESLEHSSLGPVWRRRMLYELRRTPALLRRVGVRRIPTARTLGRSDLAELRDRLPWAPATLALHFAALRRFVRWAENPLAADREAWAVPAGAAGRRRWLKREQLARLFRAARGRERLLVSLEGFNGLRRVEVLRLRWQDVDLPARRLRVLGKGRNGGKWRVVPLFPDTERIVRGQRNGDAPATRLLPVSPSGADLILRRAATRSGLERDGIRVSHHDLRRTFGRLSHEAGMDLVQLKNLYGHASLDQTVHYIGLDEDRMRDGLARFARMMGPLLHRRGT